jgi:hypothetical protein
MDVLIVWLLIGLVLGQRFKILVLVPTIVLVVALTLTIGIARADAFWPIVLKTVIAITSLQLGYFLGNCLRGWVLQARASRSRASSVVTADAAAPISEFKVDAVPERNPSAADSIHAPRGMEENHSVSTCRATALPSGLSASKNRK